jgi:hypothetical protein
MYTYTHLELLKIDLSILVLVGMLQRVVHVSHHRALERQPVAQLCQPTLQQPAQLHLALGVGQFELDLPPSVCVRACACVHVNIYIYMYAIAEG